MRMLLCCLMLGLASSLSAASFAEQLAVVRPDRRQRDQAKALVVRYLDGLDADGRAGLPRILQEELFRNDGRDYNHALDLLVLLLERGAWQAGDSITLALALANNHLLASGDDAVREAVRRDVLVHYRLYGEVIAWQRTVGVRLDLAGAPLAAKVYWAVRSRSLPERAAKSRLLTLSYYREFVDSIDSLRHMQALVRRIWPARVSGVHGLANVLEAWVRNPAQLEYRAAIDHLQRTAARGNVSPDLAAALREYAQGGLYETVYFGRKRRWDGYGWLNYQVRRLAAGKKIRGDCYTMTTMQLNLYKAAGIPAFGEQVWSVNPKFYHHNSPRFFHPVWRRWLSIQQPAEEPQGYYNYFDKPVWHHRLYERYGHRLKPRDGLKVWNIYWPGERTSYAAICSHRGLGFTIAAFDRLLWGHGTLTEGVIFTTVTAPARVPDSDGDGIPDPVEAERGTNPAKVDTDGDGLSDQYELDSGSDPRRADSPSRPVWPVLDGLAVRERTLTGMTTLVHPAGRHDADADIHDIKSISAGIVADQLYVNIGYHNDIRFNQSRNRTLRVTAAGMTTAHWFIQWSGGACRVYRFFPERTGADRLVFVESRDWPMGTLVDTEFLVPLSFFFGAKTLFVWYQSTGMKAGKRSNGIAISKKIRIDLAGGSGRERIRKGLAGAQVFTDPAGDARGRVDAHDVKQVSLRVAGDRLFMRVSFHNPVTGLPDVLHTLEVRDATDHSHRLFFQTRDIAACTLYEGTKRSVLGPDRFALYRDGNDLLFEYDISLLAGTGPLEVRYRAGSNDGERDRVINSDLAGYYRIGRQ